MKEGRVAGQTDKQKKNEEWRAGNVRGRWVGEDFMPARLRTKR